MIALVAAVAVLFAPMALAEPTEPAELKVVALDDLTVQKIDSAVRAADQFSTVFDVLKIVAPIVTTLFLVMLGVIGYFLIGLKQQVVAKVYAVEERIDRTEAKQDALRDGVAQRFVTRDDWIRVEGQTQLRIDRLSGQVSEIPKQFQAAIRDLKPTGG